MIARVLVFLTLFGGGLALLLQLTEAELPTKFRPKSPPIALTENTGVVLDDPETVSAVLIPRGRLEYGRSLPTEAGWSRRFEVQAPDSRMVPGGGVLLDDLEMQLFDPSTGDLFGIVEAQQGRTELIQSPDSLRPEMSNRIDLEQVTLTLLSGTRLVPLVLTTERLSGDLERGTFETDVFARVQGSGLTAEGEGLSLDLASGLARFTRDAECEVSGAGSLSGSSEGSGRIASAGPLTIRRLEGGDADRLELVAEQRALLAIEGEDGLRLGARAIRLVGRSAETEASSEPAREPTDGSDEATGEDLGEGSLVFESLEGEGDVTLVVQGHEFTSERALLRTSSAGLLSDARLEGSPSAWLRVQAPDEVALGPADEVVRVWGDSSMTLNWEPDVGFVVAGPARLSWRETSLWASGGVSGSPPTDEEPARFHAWTSVRIEYDGWQIETDELDGRIEVQESDAEAYTLWLEAEEETLIRGATPEDESVRLRALRGLSFRGGNEGWTVPEARGVQLTLASDRPVNAVADRLQDFDPSTQAFRADGGVELNVEDTFLRGARLEADGLQDLRLFGDDQQLVTYDTTGVHVEARRITRSGTRVTAEENVRSRLALEGLASEIIADRMELFGAALSEVPGEREVGPTTLIANGNVDARIGEADGHYDLNGDYLWLERTPIEDERAAITELRMTGDVTAESESSLGRFRLRSRELEGLLFDSGDVEVDVDSLSEDADGQLVARGDVWLETLDDRQMQAEAERLTLLPGGRAILEPAEGGRVHVTGLLPRQQRPFELYAQRVDATEDRIEAERPTLTLLPPREAGIETPLDGLRATSLTLVATPERIELDGDVSVLGNTPKGQLWSLLAQRTVFEGSATEGVRLALARMTAEGRVELEFSDGPRALGDRLTATTWSGRVRLEGQPALVFLRGHATGNTWFEFDTSDFLLRGGPGWIGQPDEVVR